MTLQEYIVEQTKRLEEFQQWWIASHELAPDKFPMSLMAGDWDEQEQFFKQTR